MISSNKALIIAILLIVIFVGSASKYTLANQDQYVLAEDFSTDQGGFTYVDDTFRQTTEPAYANGNYIETAGETGGYLRVTLGRPDKAKIYGMSGGWKHEFILSAETNAVLSFSYNLRMAAGYDFDEFSEVMVTIDGQKYGTSANDYVADLIGNDQDSVDQSTGWQTFTAPIDKLPPGKHTLIIGGYNNKKTYPDEITHVLIDNVSITQ